MQGRGTYIVNHLVLGSDVFRFEEFLQRTLFFSVPPQLSIATAFR